MLQMLRCTRLIALAASVVFRSMLGSPTISAQEQTPTPLVAVEGPLQQVIVDGFFPPQNIDISSLGLFVLPGRDVVESDFFRAAGISVLKGPATAALYEELRGHLAASRAGLQRDCSMPNAIEEASFDWKITWSGRHGRLNVFRVVTEDRDQSLPPCPNEVLTLIEEIFHFRFEFSRLPTTELIFSGPR